jgi:hypothetical protein
MLIQPDDRMDDAIPEIARAVGEPPRVPADAMWRRIEEAHFRPALVVAPSTRRARSAWRWVAQGVGIAAALAVGVALGRFMANRDASRSPVPAAATGAAAGPQRYRVATSQYLGQMETLLATLPQQRTAESRDTLYAQATELLGTTRLLMDSPAAGDTELRSLLDDLELVLAQVVRYTARHDAEGLDLITNALKDREVVPRLQNAVKNLTHSATN